MVAFYAELASQLHIARATVLERFKGAPSTAFPNFTLEKDKHMKKYQKPSLKELGLLRAVTKYSHGNYPPVGVIGYAG